jgi:DegV family protein with EDD domain
VVRIGAEAYPDRGPVADQQVAQRVRQSVGHAEVTAPSVEDFTALYRTLRETCDGVLSVHVSSKLSETVSNALTAREAFGPMGRGGPFPIAVVDSMSVGMGLGWVVLGIAQAAQAAQGASELTKLATLTTRLAGQCHVAFFTEHLDGLMHAGHLNPLLARHENFAGLKPLFHLDEGRLVVYERTRTRAKARDALYNFVEDFPKIGDIAVFHTGAHTDLDHLLVRIGAIYPRDRIMVIQTGLALSAWLGPDALGVAVVEGEEI